MEDIKQLKDRIETVSKSHQINIGRILMKNKIVFCENKNGVFVNLTDVDKTVIEELKKYMIHIDFQEECINEIETKKQEVKDKYFTNVNEVCE